MSLSYRCVVIIEVYLRGRTQPCKVCPADVGSSFNMSMKTKSMVSAFDLDLFDLDWAGMDEERYILIRSMIHFIRPPNMNV